MCARTRVPVYVSFSWLQSVALDVLCLWKWLTQGFISLHLVSICCYEISASRSSTCISPFCDTLKGSPEKALKKCSASVPNPGMCEADLEDWMSGVWHVNDTKTWTFVASVSKKCWTNTCTVKKFPPTST